MNLRLFTGPSRSEILQTLFRRLPIGYGRVCAVVPDMESARRLERQIAEQNGGASFGTRIYTFDRIAQDICALDAVPPALIPHHLKWALIHELIGSRIGGESKWRSISGCPGFASLVSSYLEDIRSGVIVNRDDTDLDALARAYQSHLVRLGSTDHEGFIEKALEGDAAERFARSFNGPLVIEGFYDLTPLQFELTSRLAAHFRRSAVCVVNDTSRPELFSLPDALCNRFRDMGAITVYVPAEPRTPVDRVLGTFMNGAEPVQEHTVSDSDLAIHTFRSKSSEADWIAGTIRNLLADDVCKPADIMVVSRHAAADDSPLYYMLQRHGVPVKSGISRPLVLHPVSVCILTALDASVNPTEENLNTVRRSSYTSLGSVSDGQDFVMNDTFGWSSMIADTDTPDGFAESMKRMIEALGIPQGLASEYGSTSEDNAACDIFLQSLEEFAAFYRSLRPMMNVRDFNRLFRRFIADVPIPVTGDTNNGILLSGVMHARYAERRIVFMTGLDNTDYPAAHDRFSLHARDTAITLAKRRAQEEPLLFLSALTGAERVYLTFPGVDDEGSIDGMSSYLAELIERTGAKDQIHPHTGVPGSAWEGGFSTERGRLEFTVKAISTAQTGGEKMRALTLKSPELADRVGIACARYFHIRTDRGIAFSHQLSLQRINRDWAPERTLPVTAIEHYRACPVAFYFQHILKLDMDEKPSDSLDGRERGSIIHDALAAFFTAYGESTGSMRLRHNDIADARAIMDKAVDDAFSRWHNDLSRLNPLVVAVERQYIKRWMIAILRVEADMQSVSSYVPYRFEESFGMQDIPPLIIEVDGETLNLRGRIDRIDRAPGSPPKYRVIDYKTGKIPWRSEVENGAALQLPLYMKALAEVLHPYETTAEGMYYNLRTAQFDDTKGRLSGCLILDEGIDDITEAACGFAIETVRGIRSGVFSSPASCQNFCSWKLLCRGGMKQMEGGDDADS